MAVDGIAGPETWTALGGQLAVRFVASGPTAKMADIAMAECQKRLRWTGPSSEAEKYLAPMRAPMQKLGQIGTKPVFFNWCASFVTWCARAAGIAIPDQPEGFWATMAKVEAWKYWSVRKGYWINVGTQTFARGDIVVFKWHPADKELDHIGIVASYANGVLMTYEGNRGNQTLYGSRGTQFVAGIIRINT